MTLDELIEKWDDGEEIITAEMGGLGTPYEQAIHNTAFEYLRYMLASPPKEDEDLSEYTVKMKSAVLPNMEKGLSGAQAGAASNVASMFFYNGYEKALSKIPDERRIRVKKVPAPGAEYDMKVA